jgi:hypothetical protein
MLVNGSRIMYVNKIQHNKSYLYHGFPRVKLLNNRTRSEGLFNSENHVQKQELPATAMLVNGSGQNVQSLERTFYRCFLPSFSSFAWDRCKNVLEFNHFFSSPCQRQYELLPSLGIRRLSSVNFSHFNLLLWNPIYGRSSIKIAHFVPIH